MISLDLFALQLETRCDLCAVQGGVRVVPRISTPPPCHKAARKGPSLLVRTPTEPQWGTPVLSVSPHPSLECGESTDYTDTPPQHLTDEYEESIRGTEYAFYRQVSIINASQRRPRLYAPERLWSAGWCPIEIRIVNNSSSVTRSCSFGGRKTINIGDIGAERVCLHFSAPHSRLPGAPRFEAQESVWSFALLANPLFEAPAAHCRKKSP